MSPGGKSSPGEPFRGLIELIPHSGSADAGFCEGDACAIARPDTDPEQAAATEVPTPDTAESIRNPSLKGAIS